MTVSNPIYPSLVDALWPAGRVAPAIRGVLLAVCGSLALWVSAKIQVPMWPVPMTMQPFVVLVIGMAFGWRLGAATVLLYLAEGFVGLPVFAGASAGPAYFAGPTAGYLIGFVAAAAATGWLAERGWDRSILGTAGAMLVGTALIYAFGVTWLANLIGLPKAITAGLLPFLLGDLVKLALAAGLMPLTWRVIGRPKA